MRYPTLLKHGHAASVGFRARGVCFLEVPNIELSVSYGYDPSCIFPTSITISDSLCPCQRRTSGRIRERGAWGRASRLGRLCGNGLVKPVQAAGNAM